MKFFVVFLSTMAMLLGWVSGEIPADFPKCKNNDEECLTKALASVLQRYPTGNMDIHLDGLDPIVVDTFHVEGDPNSPANIDLIINNARFYFLNGTKVNFLKGLRADLKGRNIMDFTMPQMRVIGQYKIKGRILILPIAGNGNCNITLYNNHVVVTFDLKNVTKNGQTYAEVNHLKVVTEPKREYFIFENLFNGQTELSNQMNQFLNENSDEVYGELAEPIGRAFTKFIKPIVNKFISSRPYAEHFL